jgi:hypothetical protein
VRERDRVVESLRVFYDRQGLSPGEKFCCPHAAECIRDAAPRTLVHGAEAHVGTRYGAALRLVVISLDTGGGAATVEERTRMIEDLPGTRLNPHMRGTLEITAELLRPDISEEQPFPYFAMINAAKCSGDDSSMNMVPGSLYDRCRLFAWEELELLAPQVIVSQGRRARAVLPRGKRPARGSVDVIARELGSQHWVAEWLWALTSRYLKWIPVSGTQALAVITPHPSARGGQWQRFAVLDMKALAWLVRGLLPLRAVGQAAAADGRGC